MSGELEVAGSSPVIPTKVADVAQWVRALKTEKCFQRMETNSNSIIFQYAF